MPIPSPLTSAPHIPPPQGSPGGNAPHPPGCRDHRSCRLRQGVAGGYANGCFQCNHIPDERLTPCMPHPFPMPYPSTDMALPPDPIKGARMLRRLLNPVMCADTACIGIDYSGAPSRGHCASASIIFFSIYGGDLASTTINGESHWFNKLLAVDIDLTLDQYGAQQEVSIAPGLHDVYRIRPLSDVSAETWLRSMSLMSRAWQHTMTHP